MKSTLRLLSLTAFSLIILLASGQSANDWTSKDFFAVYRFSDKVMGLTIDLGYTTPESPFVDSLYDSFRKKKIDDETGTIADAVFFQHTDDFDFYRSVGFEKAVLANINRTFYIYGTRGMAKRYIKDVVVATETNCSDGLVIFRFNEVDSTVGDPLFCSTKIIDLNRNVKQEIAYQANTSFKGDYAKLETPYKAFARNGDLFFLFADNFKWRLPNEPKPECMFPGRMAVKFENGKLVRVWGTSLDLFGIPCD